jgi:hypothetical protein
MTHAPTSWTTRLSLCLVVATAACTTDGPLSPPPVPEPDPAQEYPLLGCDPLVPSYCAFPFPSNVFSAADATSPTGRRVHLLPDAMPRHNLPAGHPDPAPWNRLDGFSPGMAIMAQFPELTPGALGNLPSSLTIERSLDDDCPTVLLEADTGRRVPHWVDLDATVDADDERSFMIRPAERLRDATRYIVAIRQLEDASGTPIEPSDAFLDLRDRRPSEEPSVEDRRALYADIFGRLDEAGVARDDLLLAWDFTTSSRENNTAWMLHMRDEAFALVGPDGPEIEIVTEEADWDPDHVAHRLEVDMRVPLYLEHTGPGAKMIFGADGLPRPNPAQPWAEFRVEILIPHAATQQPAALMQYGHGMLGGKSQIRSGHFLSFIEEYNYAIFGVDFIGMASDDEPFIGALLDNGRFEEWQWAVERQHQGMLNSLLAMHMMKTALAQHPVYGPMLDPDQAFYLGISQGGIFGGTYMALTTDVERGLLGVPGMPYNVLLTRSSNFEPFFDLLRGRYLDGRDVMHLLGLNQMLWDRTDPNGYMPYIRDERFPNTPPHEVVLRAVLGDHQVTTLGAHIMARAIGAPTVDMGVRDVLGLKTVAAPVTGSGLVEYDLGLPPDPVENIPPFACEDPHGKIRSFDAARSQMDTFFRTGVIENHCPNGVCAYPELGGCD